MITLKGLLSVIKSERIIKVNLYDTEEILRISFDLPGFAALEDKLEESEVTRIEIINMTTMNVYIDYIKSGE